LGGSLANADPAAELPVIMLALGARLKVRSASKERWIEAKDFFLGLFTTALEPDEMLVEIELPPSPPRTGWAFMEVAPRPGDYALMGVAVVLTLDEQGDCQRARIVYLNAGDGPLQASEAAALLGGKKPSSALFKEAATIASQKEMEPFGNIHATPAYQRHLADVLTQRALQQASVRAGEDRA
jgi:carbon-monoxide dehydrogenase medium subunit